ncbi:TrkH family potassium uptake protein [Staphylococcus kloosii]|jgi:trk system potassium uptake protein TrkH|uniref:TrkH family potassium uptake protein n=1 Tax=Staphylococcus kloosii TaxID=29384 RepID=UPI001E2ED6E9|nr:potassium transporter TrkG [Staphylococcus kloosii]MCD8878106.1 TrkH family potassium uptake protein [Staphylococcus kloosii]
MNKINKPLYYYLMLFISTTFIGALLLFLPCTGKKPIGFIDALFIASSAFTVTGLSPTDIGTQFNVLGETVILLLIQIGGLGIVTVTMLTLIFLNKKISIRNRFLIMVTWNIDEPGGIVKLVKHLAIYTIITEFIGSLCLCLSFIPKFGISKGIFVSVFTAISAFNNAGFALFKNNLIDFTKDPIVMVTVPLLIILGGLGHLVLLDLVTCKKLKKLTLHSKIVLSTTVFLILFGALTFFILETHNTMQHMSVIEKIGTSFFQSVTTRTAGFNSIDMGQINTSTALLFMLLMFIGGAPLSAAGGIKVTTFAILVMFVISTIRKHNYVELFNREIPHKLIKLATVTFIVSLCYVVLVTFVITVLNPNVQLIKILFEVISAFGTVGLTMDYTDKYHGVTELLIIFVMLSGKVGILTVLRAFVTPKDKKYHYAQGHIHL